MSITWVSHIAYIVLTRDRTLYPILSWYEIQSLNVTYNKPLNKGNPRRYKTGSALQTATVFASFIEPGSNKDFVVFLLHFLSLLFLDFK